MSTQAAVIFEDDLLITAEVHHLEAFRRWAYSRDFPERGRIDYLAGEIEVAMSPEDLYTHGAVKTSLTTTLHRLVAEADRGTVFVDRTRVSSPRADLSAEPDVVVALDESFDQGRLREIPSAGGQPGRYIELEGAPDLVVEIVSDSSTGKDTRRLPPLYARAGIPELWLVDARGDKLSFKVQTLEDGSYLEIEPDAGGWRRSPVLGLTVRLSRKMTRRSRWRYLLETRD